MNIKWAAPLIEDEMFLAFDGSLPPIPDMYDYLQSLIGQVHPEFGSLKLVRITNVQQRSDGILLNCEYE